MVREKGVGQLVHQGVKRGTDEVRKQGVGRVVHQEVQGGSGQVGEQEVGQLVHQGVEGGTGKVGEQRVGQLRWISAFFVNILKENRASLLNQNICHYFMLELEKIKSYVNKMCF